MGKVYSANALIGGAAGALDEIDGAGLSDKDVALVAIQDGSLMPYVLDADSGEAENSPLIISPDTNAGTKRWKLLTGGNSAFSHVHAQTTTESIPSGSDTTVVYDTESYDDLGEYNNTTGIFTAKYAGRYIVSCGIYFPTTSSWSAGNQVVLIIEKQGTSIYRAQKHAERSASYRLGKNLSGTVELAVGETIQISAYQNSGSTLSVEASGNYNYITIDRIA
jgi:hypothetical protein